MCVRLSRLVCGHLAAWRSAAASALHQTASKYDRILREAVCWNATLGGSLALCLLSIWCDRVRQPIRWKDSTLDDEIIELRRQEDSVRIIPVEQLIDSFGTASGFEQVIDNRQRTLSSNWPELVNTKLLFLLNCTNRVGRPVDRYGVIHVIIKHVRHLDSGNSQALEIGGDFLKKRLGVTFGKVF